MNPELPNNPREELELRITALLLGELSADEAAAVRKAITKDAELTKLHDDLKQTIVLVREASSMKETVAPQAEALKLSEERRQKLLTAFKIPPLKEEHRKPRGLFQMTLIEVLAVVALVGVLVALFLPTTKSMRSVSTTESDGRLARLASDVALERAKAELLDEIRKPSPVTPLPNNTLQPDASPVIAQRLHSNIELPALADVDGETSSDKAEQIGLRFRTWGEKSERYPARKADGDIAAVAALKTIPKGGTGSGGQGGGGAGGSIPGQTDSGRNVVSFNPSTGAPTRQSALDESIVLPATPPPPPPASLPEIATAEPNTASGIDLQRLPESEVRQIIQNGRDVASGGSSGGGRSGGISGVVPPPSKGIVGVVTHAGSLPVTRKSDVSISNKGASEPAGVAGIPFPQESSQVLAYGITDATKAKEGKVSNYYSLTAGFDSGQEAALSKRPWSASASITAGIDSMQETADKSNRTTSKNWSVATNSSGAAVARYYTGTEREQLARKGDVALAIADGPKNLGEAVRQSVAVDALGVLPAGQNSPTDAKTYAYLEQKRKVDGLRRQLALSDYEASGGSASPLLESDLYRTYEKQAQAYTERYVTLTNEFGKSDGANTSWKELETQIKIAKAELDSVNDRLNDAKRADNARSEETRPYFEAKKKLEELGRALVESQSDPAPPRKPSTNAPIPQPEIQTSENNFSTFSLNVSDVSFKLAAASLEKGQMPDAASVRSEEFINAFDYRDPEPQGSAPIAFTWERARYPFAHNRDLLRFSLKTAAAGRQAGRPLNIVLLLDNSGSMERADRVLIRREALRVLASQLQPQDKLSVITFARTARLVVGGVAGDKAGEVLDQVSSLTPEGGTNLEEAMNLAYQIAAKHYLASGINRVVLLTDGAANLGEVEPSSLKQKVEAQRKQGIALDCFGIGWEGFNDDLLEVLSRNGDGRYGFLNSPEEAATDFAGQLAGALKVAASDVKVQVEFNPKRVTSYRQIGYAKHQLTKEQFRDNTVDAAEIAAQEAGNALYTVESNPAGEGPLATVRVRYKVPGTTDYREQSWDVPFTGNALLLEQSSPAMRLAASASAFSEWLVASPFAGEVKPDALLGFLRGVPEVYGADARPKKLEWMIRQAKSVAGQ